MELNVWSRHAFAQDLASAIFKFRINLKSEKHNFNTCLLIFYSQKAFFLKKKLDNQNVSVII